MDVSTRWKPQTATQTVTTTSVTPCKAMAQSHLTSTSASTPSRASCLSSNHWTEMRPMGEPTTSSRWWPRMSRPNRGSLVTLQWRCCQLTLMTTSRLSTPPNCKDLLMSTPNQVRDLPDVLTTFYCTGFYCCRNTASDINWFT